MSDPRSCCGLFLVLCMVPLVWSFPCGTHEHGGTCLSDSASESDGNETSFDRDNFGNVGDMEEPSDRVRLPVHATLLSSSGVWSPVSASTGCSGRESPSRPRLSLDDIFGPEMLTPRHGPVLTSSVSEDVTAIPKKPASDASISEKERFTFEYAIRRDKLWTLPGFDCSKRRRLARKQCEPIAPILWAFLEDTNFDWHTTVGWQQKRDAWSRLRGWYGQVWNINKTLALAQLVDFWATVSSQVVKRWIFVLRLSTFVYENSCPGQPLSLKTSVLGKVEPANATDGNPIVESTVALLVTYNTPFGEDDPDIRRLILEGQAGEGLFEKMRKHVAYGVYFRRFWDFLSRWSKRLGWPNTAACMEWSSNSSFLARVHLHGYLAPSTRRGAWDHKVEQRSIRQDDLVFEGIRPDRQACNVKNRYRTVAIGNGLFYVTCGKVGTMYQETTLRPYEDRLE